MNLTMLIGRLTKDPEVRYTNGDQGTMIASFTLAVDRKYKRDGQPTADFIPVKAFGKTAEIIEKYCHKGKQVAIAGEIQTGSYTNKEGKKVYTTDVIANQLTLLGAADQPAKTTQHAQAPAPAPEPQQQALTASDFNEYEGDDDLPF